MKELVSDERFAKIEKEGWRSWVGNNTRGL